MAAGAPPEVRRHPDVTQIVDRCFALCGRAATEGLHRLDAKMKAITEALRDRFGVPRWRALH